jgi:hypothetical protein
VNPPPMTATLKRVTPVPFLSVIAACADLSPLNH